MPLFGFRKDKKYDKDYAKAAETVKAKPGKQPKAVKEPAAAKNAAATKKPVRTIPSSGFSSATDVVIRPRVTEKSGLLSQQGAYTFEIAGNATKQSVAKAVKSLYKVNPVKVTIQNLPSKSVFVKGRRGTVSGVRKAVVTVKQGEKIDFV